MSNSLLTIDMITRKALEILENNLVLTRNVNRQYDDSFATEGAKIGSTLRIRLPDRALVTDGAALQVQDDNEQFTTLTVNNQKHIGVSVEVVHLKDGLHIVALLDFEWHILVDVQDATNHLDVGCWKDAHSKAIDLEYRVYWVGCRCVWEGSVCEPRSEYLLHSDLNLELIGSKNLK